MSQEFHFDRRRRPGPHLGQELEGWNLVAQEQAARREVASRFYRRMARTLIADLTPQEFKVAQFIAARTLGWGKYAETITYKHFLNGLRDQQGNLLRDEWGECYCAGLGTRKEDTVRRAINSLLEKGLIERFEVQVSGQSSFAYMPMPRDLIAQYIVSSEGCLPHEWAGIARGEFLADHSGLYEVTDFDDRRVQCFVVGPGGGRRGQPIVLRRSSLRRPPPEKMLELRRSAFRNVEEILHD